MSHARPHEVQRLSIMMFHVLITGFPCNAQIKLYGSVDSPVKQGATLGGL